MNKIKILPAPGVMLVSEPFLQDSYYKRSVVLLSEHDERKGTNGFIINKITDVKLNDAVEDFAEFDTPLYFGGPIETDTLFYVHTVGRMLKNSKQIIPGLWHGGDYEQLQYFINTRQIQPHQIRFYAGYAAWDPKQLNGEIYKKSWLLSRGEIKFAFFDDCRKLWASVLRSMGSEYAILANFPEDPSLN